jgi:hypothetical protein
MKMKFIVLYSESSREGGYETNICIILLCLPDFTEQVPDSSVRVHSLRLNILEDISSSSASLMNLGLLI